VSKPKFLYRFLSRDGSLIEGVDPMNAPNLITIGRFFLIPLFLLLFFSNLPQANLLSFLVLLLAGLSDMLDGYLARKKGQITDIGKLLDPLADKVMMLSVIFAFVIDQRISWLAAGLFIFRDVGMIVTSAFFHFKGKSKVPAANLLGKATTVLYYIVFLMIMFKWSYYKAGLWFVIAFSFITSLVYLFTYVKLHEQLKRASQ
jgi:cardiolipin synthase